jgi:hypothetical protein
MSGMMRDRGVLRSMAWGVVACCALMHSVRAQDAAPAARCDVQSCSDGDQLLYRFDLPPQTTPLATPALPPAGVMNGDTGLELPQGGVIWLTEDPSLTRPALTVQAGSLAPFEAGVIQRPVRFHSFSNYSAFIERLVVTVYRASDTDLVAPLATVELPTTPIADVQWDGALPASLNLRVGDELLYIARAYGAQRTFDETIAQRIRLVTPAEFNRGSELASAQQLRENGQVVTGNDAQVLELSDATYGQNNLRLQNIVIRGSRVRVQGSGVPRDTRVSINGQVFPVDQNGMFSAEFLEPLGEHRYDVRAVSAQAPPAGKLLRANVTGRYAYAVALADVTLGQRNASDSVIVDGVNDQDDFLNEGRLAFYLKGKTRGKYVVTAQADTRNNQLDHLFDGFFEADPQDIFWRLDPDLYYPTYGDDSLTYRDVDTQGKLYLRADWDQSQALWGNYLTGITGTQYGQYSRALYGAALDWRSPATTPLGEARRQLRVFGSQARTSAGHSEFLGTGGSLYYLRHTDILRGSEQVVLEIRDPTTGLTESRVNLQRNVDYEIDELQGRLILTRPLAQITRENVRTLTRETPLDGYGQLLLVDYEYVPSGFEGDDLAMGFRGKQWFNDHLAVGATYVDDNSGGSDYSLKGGDLTLQAGRGTYIKAELTQSEATATPVFYSDNGGLSFIQRNPLSAARRGEAWALDARANLRELGLTPLDWTMGAWWREVDAGFSISRFDTGAPVQEYGAEFLGYFTTDFSLYGRYSRAEQGAQSLAQTQLTTDWRLDERQRLGAELRKVDQQGATVDADALLVAASYRYQVTVPLELYGVAQYTADDDSGRYARNNRLTVGANYQTTDRLTLGAEASDGSRGFGSGLQAEYRVRPEQTVYGTYRYTAEDLGDNLWYDPSQQNGWTLGQRWRITDRTNVFNESQYLKDVGSDASGITHTVGMDFSPAVGWTLGATVMDGQLDAVSGRVNRRAYSLSGGRTDERMQWTSKLEYRRDSGAERRTQWVTTNRMAYRLNEDWRLALRANYADTDDDLNPLAGAKLAEINTGFAWRPHDTTRWAAFGKYTYLYDVATLGQEGASIYDQRSHVLALEGIYQLNDRWELAGKLSARRGEYRDGRGQGQWLDSRTEFAALQVRYQLIARWDALAEYRMTTVTDSPDRTGWLVGVDRQIGENFRIGIGWNFTRFGDDLTQVREDRHGFFVNLAGYY